MNKDDKLIIQERNLPQYLITTPVEGLGWEAHTQTIEDDERESKQHVEWK